MKTAATVQNQAGERTQHTPGPWYQNGFSVRGDLSSTICIAGMDAQTNWNANSRLIAAAPELLNALKAAQKYVPMGDEPENSMIAAAIAKAEGNQ